MSSHLVDGVPLPDQVCGHPALEFCNTRAGWGTATPREYLTSPRAVLLWASDVAALSSVTTPLPREPLRDHAVQDRAALASALTLRDALYACALHRGTDHDWDVVTGAVRAAHEVAVLRPGRHGGPARWHLPFDAAQARGRAAPGAPGAVASVAPGDVAPGDVAPGDVAPGGVAAVAHAVALAAEELLTSPRHQEVAACPGEGCGWLFADPRGRRRWCSMAVCGNRAKARRHSQRLRAQ